MSLRDDASSSAFSALPLLFQSIIGVVVGAVLFAPKWAKLPIKTENEFILYRYKDPFRKTLFYFRATYLGWIIIPLLMSISISSLYNPNLFPAEYQKAFFLLFIVLSVIFTFINSLKQRIHIDTFIGTINILFVISYFFFALFNGSTNTNPFIQKNAFNSADIVLVCGMLWWFNNIIDMPDMRAQKLLVMRSEKGAPLVILSPVLFMFLFEAFLVWGPNVQIPNLIIQLLLLLNLTQVISSLQHWSGSLTHESLLIHLYKKKSPSTSLSYVSLFIPLSISLLYTFYYRNTAESLLTFFGLTAGVGVVYILRWYWWRINALTQLIAMICPIILQSLSSFILNCSIIQRLIEYLPFQPQYSIFLIFGLINVFAWFPTLFLFTRLKSQVLPFMKK